MFLQKLYQDQLEKLKKSDIESPLLDLDLIFCEVLGIQRHELILQENKLISNLEVNTINEYIDRRIDGEPLAYLFGYKEFYKSKFIVNKNVLVPRPETELIVEKAMDHFEGKKGVKILDMGAGSGCIGLSLLGELKEAELTAIDISLEALVVLKENYKQLNLKNKLVTINSDINSLDYNKYLDHFDLIVANPPYVDRKGYIQESVKKYEPEIALFSPQGGLRDVFNWTKFAQSSLKIDGYLLMEFGDNQCQKIVNFMDHEDIYLEYLVHKDYSGLPRFIEAKKTRKS